MRPEEIEKRHTFIQAWRHGESNALPDLNAYATQLDEAIATKAGEVIAKLAAHAQEQRDRCSLEHKRELEKRAWILEQLEASESESEKIANISFGVFKDLKAKREGLRTTAKELEETRWGGGDHLDTLISYLSALSVVQK